MPGLVQRRGLRAGRDGGGDVEEVRRTDGSSKPPKVRKDSTHFFFVKCVPGPHARQFDESHLRRRRSNCSRYGCARASVRRVVVKSLRMVYRIPAVSGPTLKLPKLGGLGLVIQELDPSLHHERQKLAVDFGLVSLAVLVAYPLL